MTNNFADIFAVTNTVAPVINYLDVGSGTNVSSRYYSVRLVPVCHNRSLLRDHPSMLVPSFSDKEVVKDCERFHLDFSNRSLGVNGFAGR